ncbi:SDR family NAD(P)-dependent oxidoreductase [Phycisphaerales bacterium AB-hyl4]|uniref:SDR family NAD(P)-dependent oxidoreductase n=1 Tax=Natronomicrosphaera hydrolytica TaxID=3242702 RepID=A0ABV4U5C1_9BACT
MGMTADGTIKGRVAVVTGAATGIGRAIAVAYAEAGAKVVCVSRRMETLRPAVDAITNAGHSALAVQADTSDAEQVEAAVQQAVDAFGRIDILVNNAGFLDFSPIMDVSEELFDRTFAVNVKGYFLFSQAAARQMIQQGVGGSIINITSISAEQCGELKVHYCASNAARKMLTKGFALELAKHQIRVNAVAPGDIESDIVRDPNIQHVLDSVDFGAFAPLGRRGKPDDIVGACIFLASEQAGYITGSTLLIDGGAFSGVYFPRAADAPA